mmetsp:Transcript_34247/g.60860  ORF Transcript_34247/g.60860 Transcript_34247/m.60860 type:complete len:181 (+) Transcript_34247:54-596(+)
MSWSMHSVVLVLTCLAHGHASTESLKPGTIEDGQSTSLSSLASMLLAYNPVLPADSLVRAGSNAPSTRILNRQSGAKKPDPVMADAGDKRSLSELVENTKGLKEAMMVFLAASMASIPMAALAFGDGYANTPDNVVISFILKIFRGVFIEDWPFKWLVVTAFNLYVIVFCAVLAPIEDNT